MTDLIREAAIGQIIRFVSGNRYLRYPEEEPGFQTPPGYLESSKNTTPSPPTEKARSPSPSESSDSSNSSIIPPATKDDEEATLDAEVLTPSRSRTTPFTEGRLEAEEELELEKTKSIPIRPQKTSDGIILVDWYTTDDPANPQNWSSGKKFFVAMQICLYTFAFYCGSAIFVPSEGGIMERFHASATKASLGLALYVLAYGVGPLLWSPISEIPVVGRNVPYIATLGIFVVLCVPTALVDNFSGLLALRFLQGFFGSPALATGGATMQDMYSLLKIPYLMTAWVASAYAGPALGPLLSGFAVTAENWRWSLWEILWLVGPVFILMFLCLPETSASNILLRRAKRLRALTGDHHLKSQSEIDQAHLSISTIATDALIKPIEISLKDPGVMFTNLYTALTYGIYYSFFEVFPLVYPPMYGFNLGLTGVTFVCILVACLIGVAAYGIYYRVRVEPDIVKNGLRVQESRLVPALFAVFGPTAGLFLFGWTANPSIHWIASVIGITIYGASVFVILQCIFVYLPLSYPQYAASLFAANDFCRSAMAAGAILFARPLYINLGVGKGISVLGGISVVGIFGMYTLYFYGANLRARSKFALK